MRLYNLSVKNDATEAEVAERRALQYKLSCVEEIVVRFGTVGVKEATSRLLGFGDRDGTRLPLMGGLPGGDAEWEHWRGCMDELQAVEKTLPEVK